MTDCATHQRYDDEPREGQDVREGPGCCEYPRPESADQCNLY